MCRWGQRHNAALVVVATHQASEKQSRVGLTRAGLVDERFFTHLPQGAFTAAAVVALSLHRGASAPVLADEDQEQDPDRWCSHAPCGKPAWQSISQWVWNLRLELGQHLEPTPMRTTEVAPAPQAKEQPAPSSGSGPPTLGAPWKAGRLSGRAVVLQPDGTLRCPAQQGLAATEQRREAAGSLRLVYAAKLRKSRPCPRLRAVSMAWPRHDEAAPGQPAGASAPGWVCSPAASRAWSRRQQRRACMGAARATNGGRSPFRRPRLPSHTTRRATFPVRSVPMSALRGKNGWRVMPVPRPLTDPPSSRSRVPAILATFLGRPPA